MVFLVPESLIPAQEMAETFESAIPAYLDAARPGSVSLSSRHSKHGERSVRWDWQPGEALCLRPGLGDIRRQGGYGGTYLKATFGVWLYCERRSEGALTFEFRTGEKIGGTFAVSLDFTGWQRAHLRYSWRSQFEGRVSGDTDTIVVRAPRHAPDSGTIFFDLIVYNGILDYRQQRVPGQTSWQPVVPDPARFPVPGTVDAAESAGLAAVAGRPDAEAARHASASPEAVAELGERLRELGISRALRTCWGPAHSRA